MRVENAEFLLGATSLSGMPDSNLPEIAIVGRSNAGKSTLINRICNRKKLARTSSTPGRTQEINFFDIELAMAGSPKLKLQLVDLPGFGYAKFSKEKRETTSRLIIEYIANRAALSVICLLNDSKRTPGEDELAIRDVAFELDIPIVVIATKLDRLNQKDKNKNLKKMAQGYGLEKQDLVLSGENISPQLIWERVVPLL